jgi:hypothetical protein
MSDWLKKCKSEFQEQIFEFLWQQWSSLGVAGLTETQNERIIDPDALLLFSLSVCRYEPRLFDEIIDWLFQNGHFINVQRLGQIQKKYDFRCGPQLSATAQLLSKNSKYKLKWSGLAEKFYQDPPEPLFFDKMGVPLPCPQNKDANPEFLNHGLRRSPVNLREYSQPFSNQSPACLLLRLRALIGINARAEILCLLASFDEIHPSRAARQTGYTQKTIQTTLLEMAQSKFIQARTSKKEKYYRLKPKVLDALLRPKGKAAKWINWPATLKAVEIIWHRLSRLENQELDPLLLASELKNLKTSIRECFFDSGGCVLAPDDTIEPENITDVFQSDLKVICSQLIFG